MIRPLSTLLVVGVLLSGCGSDGNDSDGTADATTATTTTSVASTEGACRASFQTYSDQVAADSTGILDEAPLQAATVMACGSADEWTSIAGEFQGPSNELFPPRPTGGLEHVLEIFCDDSPEAPTCS